MSCSYTTMKLILTTLVFEIFLIFLQCDQSHESKIIIQKRTPGKLQKHLKILNGIKFKKYKSDVKQKRVLDGNTKYTVFPTILEKDVIITDKLFYVDKSLKKTRVKKNLQGYQIPIIRKKRSANNTSPKITKKGIKRNNKIKGNQTKTTQKKKTTKKKTKKITSVVKLSKPQGNKTKNEKKSTPKSNQNKTQKNRKVTKKKNILRSQKKPKSKKPKARAVARKQAKTTKKNVRSKNKKGTVRKVRSRRLIAGKEALIEDYPYVISIQKDGEHWCSGALLNQRLGITTANCLWKANRMSRMRVRACSRFSDYGGQRMKIQEVMKHPKWSIRSAPDNDVAIIVFDRFIRFTDKCHAADLPNRAMIPAFEDAWVTSWGADRRDGVFEQTATPLQVYHAQLVQREKCNNVTHRYGVHVTENFLCLAQSGKRAPCTRDTGAPAVSDGIVWGLASWGIRKLCGTDRFPAMFSYLASPSNLDFITNATHILMSDERHYPYKDKFPQRLGKRIDLSESTPKQ